MRANGVLNTVTVGITILAVLFLPGSLWGQSVKLPVEVKGIRGAFVVVRAETDCASLKWLVLDSGLSLIPPDLLKDSKVAIIQASEDGRYRLLAYGAKGDSASEPSICTVVIGSPAPGPDPGPGPGPKPPPSPDPADPLFPALKVAFAAETDPAKKDLAGKLAEFYREAAATARRPDLNTWGALFKVMESVSVSVGLKGKLQACQLVFQPDLKAISGTANAAIDEAGKAKVAALFLRFASLMEALK
jgi:hypothetical protein